MTSDAPGTGLRRLLDDFRACAQDVVRTAANNVDVHPEEGDEPTAEKAAQSAGMGDKIRSLFRFAETASWVSAPITAKRQLLSLVCSPDMYNAIDIVFRPAGRARPQAEAAAGDPRRRSRP
ncbi:hypothetical protein M3Y99_01573000 [Aphelenchoides fujianensis]|nr:hypothetical protein M3Y99_01573000 [Aphelenchoides fujianensis]